MVKKSIKRHHIIYGDIFKRGVAIIVCRREDLKRELKKTGYDLDNETAKEIIDAMDNGYLASTIEIGKGRDVLVYAEKPLSLEVLAHELLHATQFIMRTVGADDFETTAYLFEYMLHSVLTSDDALCALLNPGDASLRRLARICQSAHRGRETAASRKPSL